MQAGLRRMLRCHLHIVAYSWNAEGKKGGGKVCEPDGGQSLQAVRKARKTRCLRFPETDAGNVRQR